MVSSGRTTLRLALSQAPEHVEGEEKEKKLGAPGFYNPYVGFSQAPEHVEGGYRVREEKVVLDS
jgi:hypothetical protein